MHFDIRGIPRESRPLKELLKLRQYIKERYDGPDLPAIIEGMTMEASATNWIALSELPPVLQLSLDEAEELYNLVSVATVKCFEDGELVDGERFSVLSPLSTKVYGLMRDLGGD